MAASCVEPLVFRRFPLFESAGLHHEVPLILMRLRGDLAIADLSLEACDVKQSPAAAVLLADHGVQPFAGDVVLPSRLIHNMETAD